MSSPPPLWRPVDYTRHWRQPELLLGQACGLDVAWGNPHGLRVVGAPRFALPGCRGAQHRSYILVRDGEGESLIDFWGSRCAINSPSSQSGALGLASMVAGLKPGPFFRDVRISGSHRHSLELVQGRVVDLVAIDCVTFALLQEEVPELLGGLSCIGQTAYALCPPFVTAGHRTNSDVERLRGALSRAINSLGDNALGLVGVELVDNCHYAPQEELRRRVGKELCANLAHRQSCGWEQLGASSGTFSTSGTFSR